jgi:hypothetical protein
VIWTLQGCYPLDYQGPGQDWPKDSFSQQEKASILWDSSALLLPPGHLDHKSLPQSHHHPYDACAQGLRAAVLWGICSLRTKVRKWGLLCPAAWLGQVKHFQVWVWAVAKEQGQNLWGVGWAVLGAEAWTRSILQSWRSAWAWAEPNPWLWLSWPENTLNVFSKTWHKFWCQPERVLNQALEPSAVPPQLSYENSLSPSVSVFYREWR